MVRTPSHLDVVQAAALPLAGTTAWQAIFGKARLAAGQRLLITNSSDGGSLAVQLAKARGAHVTAVASAHNEAFVRGLGADDFIDYTRQPFEEVAHDIDVVLDTVGGETFQRAFRTLRIGGFMVTVVAFPAGEGERYGVAVTRSIGAVVLGIWLGLGTGRPAAAWPDERPIEVIVGFAAGGATDVMAPEARTVRREAAWRQDEAPGGQPTRRIGRDRQRRPCPRRARRSHVRHRQRAELPVPADDQESAVQSGAAANGGRIVDDPTVLLVRADSKYASLPDLMAALRSEPGSVSFGHNGVGTNSYLTLRLIAEATKLQANEVPYRGAAAAKTDLLGGHLTVALVSAGEVPELHGGATGELRVLAQFAKTRSRALPDVPTAEEMGLPVVMSSERGFAAEGRAGRNRAPARDRVRRDCA